MRVITYTPSFGELPVLRELWKEAFGDSDEFINMFYTTAFSPSRVFAVGEEAEDGLCLCGGLYWFDGSFKNPLGETERIAYIYAVAVSKEKRGLGYGKLLMEGVHAYLKGRGYHGVLLAPAEEGLFEFYEKLGYTTCTYRDEIHLQAPDDANPMANTLEKNRITKEAYGQMRNALLPIGGVRQENENLDYLEQMAGFYAGENYVLAASLEGEHQDILRGVEFLTSQEVNAKEVATGILKQSGCKEGVFRIIGRTQKVTMYYPLQEKASQPTYFGLIFD